MAKQNQAAAKVEHADIVTYVLTAINKGRSGSDIVSADSPLVLDSLDVVELCYDLECTYNIPTVNDEKIQKAGTVTAIAAIIAPLAKRWANV